MVSTKQKTRSRCWQLSIRKLQRSTANVSEPTRPTSRKFLEGTIGAYLLVIRHIYYSDDYQDVG